MNLSSGFWQGGALPVFFEPILFFLFSEKEFFRPHFLFFFRKGNGVEPPKEKRAWGNLPNGFPTPLLTAKGLALGCCGVWNVGDIR